MRFGFTPGEASPGVKESVGMVDIEKINWDKLKSPCASFNSFIPDPKQVGFIAERLLVDYLNMSDETRTKEYIDYVLKSYFFGKKFNVFYKIKDFAGFVGFVDIHPNYKAKVIMTFWDKKAFTHNFVKDAAVLFDVFSKEFNLMRLYSQTADDRIVWMAKKAGFKQECIQKNAFKWKGRLMPIIQLSITHDEKKRRSG